MTGVSECSQQRGNLKDDGYTKIQTLLGRLYGGFSNRSCWD
ncbi:MULTISPECIES: hypothetical protein [Photorhabdus]|nr:hypothetical protein [Photorhabdus asymbiotica]